MAIREERIIRKYIPDDSNDLKLEVKWTKYHEEEPSISAVTIESVGYEHLTLSKEQFDSLLEIVDEYREDFK